MFRCAPHVTAVQAMCRERMRTRRERDHLHVGVSEDGPGQHKQPSDAGRGLAPNEPDDGHLALLRAQPLSEGSGTRTAAESPPANASDSPSAPVRAASAWKPPMIARFATTPPSRVSARLSPGGRPARGRVGHL
jgi:hypothetical protein